MTGVMKTPVIDLTRPPSGAAFIALSLSTCDDHTFVPNIIINLCDNINAQMYDPVDGPYSRLVSSYECCDI